MPFEQRRNSAFRSDPSNSKRSSGGEGWVVFISALIAIPAGLVAIMDWLDIKPRWLATAAHEAPEDRFQITPISFGKNLSVSVKKSKTADQGKLTLFACGADNGHQAWIGETAFSTASEDYLMNGLFEGSSVILLANVVPESGEPSTVLAPWDLNGLRRLKPPTSRAGTLTCLDIAGLF